MLHNKSDQTSELETAVRKPEAVTRDGTHVGGGKHVYTYWEGGAFSRI